MQQATAVSQQAQQRRASQLYGSIVGRSWDGVLIMPWKAGNEVLITFRNETVLGLIMLASWNAASLLLQFPGKLGEHVGTMPVLLSRRGDYRSIVTDELVTLQTRKA